MMNTIIDWLFATYDATPTWLIADFIIFIVLFIFAWLVLRLLQKESARHKVKQVLRTDPESCVTQIMERTGLSEDEVEDVLEDLMMEGETDEEKELEEAMLMIKRVLRTDPDLGVDEVANRTGLYRGRVEGLMDDAIDDLMVEGVIKEEA